MSRVSKRIRILACTLFDLHEQKDSKTIHAVYGGDRMTFCELQVGFFFRKNWRTLWDTRYKKDNTGAYHEGYVFCAKCGLEAERLTKPKKVTHASA